MPQVDVHFVCQLNDFVVPQRKNKAWLHVVVDQAVRAQISDLTFDELFELFGQASQQHHVLFEGKAHSQRLHHFEVLFWPVGGQLHQIFDHLLSLSKQHIALRGLTEKYILLLFS